VEDTFENVTRSVKKEKKSFMKSLRTIFQEAQLDIYMNYGEVMSPVVRKYADFVEAL